MRRYLRFSLRTILFVVTTASIGLFWIRWPTMTASSFVANPDIVPDQILTDFESLENQMDRIQSFANVEGGRKAELVPSDRSLSDMLSGVQHFDYGAYDITARRGKIALYGPYYNFGFGKVRRQYSIEC